MTAFIRVELRCDDPGCTQVYDSGESLVTPTRRHAQRNGWIARIVPGVGLKFRSLDICPAHTDIKPDALEKL